MRRIARVLLPAGTFAETSGTYVNLEGRWQSFSGAARGLGASRPAWKILRVLGNLLDLPRFDYQSSEEVREQLRSHLAAAPAVAQGQRVPALQRAAAEPVLDVPMYAIDPVVRRSGPLQRTRDGRLAAEVYGGAA
jgi:NADH-quinone oxidoreductase subunit G